MSDIPEDSIETALARFHETAESLASIDHVEFTVTNCDYEPIFKGSVDLLDARELIAALRDERARQEERVRVLEEAAHRVLLWVEPIAGDNMMDPAAAKEEVDSVVALRAALGNGGGDA